MNLKRIMLAFLVVLNLGEGHTLAEEPIEVVPAMQSAKVQTSIDGWKTEWISEAQGLAVTTDVLVPERFRARGLLHVWSLRTGKVIRSIECPATVQVIAGDRNSPVVVVAGGPYNKNEDPPFVWIVDLRTGEPLHKLPAWPGDDGPGGELAVHQIREGALARESGKFILRFSEACALYDLARPAAPPAMLPRESWETMAASWDMHFPNLPNWLQNAGPSDGRLTVGRTSECAGVWRNDTWEQILQLNENAGPAENWMPSADGSTLLAVRPGQAREQAPHLIWDLRRFEVVEWTEPHFFDRIEPAFTADGRLLRFARIIRDERVEFVSRDWRAGEERVEHVVVLPKLQPQQWYDLEAAYSDDGSTLTVGTPAGTKIFRWTHSELEAPTVETTRVQPAQIGGVSCDGQFIYYLPKQQDGDFESREGRAWNVRGSGSVLVRPIRTLGHPPVFCYQSLTGVQGEVFAYRVSGASTGPYGFGMQTRGSSQAEWKIWPEDEMRLLAGASFVRPVGQSDCKAGVLVAWFDSALRTYDPETGRRLAEVDRRDLWPRGLRRRLTAPLAGRVFLGLKNGGVQIYDVHAGGVLKPVAQLWSPAVGSWLALLADGRYAVSPTARPPLYFRQSGKLHPLEDFDVRLNQPDAVAEALGADATTIELLRNARQRRLQRLGNLATATINQPLGPTLVLSSPPPLRHDRMRLPIEGMITAGDHSVTHIDLYVNDVPVFGAQGMALKVSSRETSRFQIEVPLSLGTNKVQLAVCDSAGVASEREFFFVHRSSEGATPTRHVLAIGIADYDDDNLDLTYAAKDAADIAAALTRGGGRAPQSRSLIMSNEKARRADILAAREFLQQSQPEDEVIVFVSGHGVVSDKGEYLFCPADFERQSCRNGVSYSDLEGLLDGIPALKRLLLLDSCHSGELSVEETQAIQAKYATRLATKGVQMRMVSAGQKAAASGDAGASRAAAEFFLDLRRTTGATVLSAAGGLEFALEGTEQKNGVFTHAILRAIERKGGETLTASVLVREVAATVQRLTESQQHPNARFTNLACDFPVIPGTANRPPGRPEDVVKNFVEWSRIDFQPSQKKAILGPLYPRLMNCFAPKVAYFGKTKSREIIEAEERAYQARFSIRSHEMKNLFVGKPLRDGEIPVRYDLEFNHGSWMKAAEADRILSEQARKKTSGWSSGNAWKNGSDGRVAEKLIYREGTLKVEALVRQIGNEWKIVSLRSTGK